MDFCSTVSGPDAPRRLTSRLAARLDRFPQMAVLAARKAVADARITTALSTSFGFGGQNAVLVLAASA
ncbi:hypothetical protein [Streptomyces sp. NPDC046887]|uniref:hypothetical protein n=1 Tax=Streptomyces sp. NPDC046887 TaxID=3155472 RepID=UPI0033DC6DD6